MNGGAVDLKEQRETVSSLSSGLTWIITISTPVMTPLSGTYTRSYLLKWSLFFPTAMLSICNLLAVT